VFASCVLDRKRLALNWMSLAWFVGEVADEGKLMPAVGLPTYVARFLSGSVLDSDLDYALPRDSAFKVAFPDENMHQTKDLVLSVLKVCRVPHDAKVPLLVTLRTR
jgi:hypothetical protein